MIEGGKNQQIKSCSLSGERLELCFLYYQKRTFKEKVLLKGEFMSSPMPKIEISAF